MKQVYTYFWKTLPIGDLISLALILLAFSKSSQMGWSSSNQVNSSTDRSGHTFIKLWKKQNCIWKKRHVSVNVTIWRLSYKYICSKVTQSKSFIFQYTDNVHISFSECSFYNDENAHVKLVKGPDRGHQVNPEFITMFQVQPLMTLNVCTPYTATAGTVAGDTSPGSLAPGPEVTEPGGGGAGPSTPSATTRGQDLSREEREDSVNSSKWTRLPTCTCCTTQ